MNLGRRLLCGLILAAVFGILGWLGAQLTVDMVLSRHFNSSQKHRIERVIPYFWITAGFLTGVGIDRRLLSSSYLRPVCWGAVTSLTAVMLCVRIPLWIDPDLQFKNLSIVGLPIGVDWETVGLISSPAALLVGGFLGGVYQRYYGQRSEGLTEDLESH